MGLKINPEFQMLCLNCPLDECKESSPACLIQIARRSDFRRADSLGRGVLLREGRYEPVVLKVQEGDEAYVGQ
jgi:hypothetical protein